MKTFQSWNPELWGSALGSIKVGWRLHLLHGESTEDRVQGNTWAVTHLSKSPPTRTLASFTKTDKEIDSRDGEWT